jgi:hypothetical protein
MFEWYRQIKLRKQRQELLRVFDDMRDALEYMSQEQRVAFWTRWNAYWYAKLANNEE